MSLLLWLQIFNKMEINNELIDKLANLAKLNFDDSAKKAIRGDLEKALTFFEKISELDTENVEPLIYMNEEVNVFRKDEAKTLISRAEGLKTAPLQAGEFIKVPKVIDK